MTRDDLTRYARRLLHPLDFQRGWFRELQGFYRHLSREEFWLRYHEERAKAAALWAAGIPAGDVYQQTDYYVLRQMYYHRDRSFFTIARTIPSGGALLEYGCGVAPVCAWLDRPWWSWGYLNWYDIPSRALEFANWRMTTRPGECDADPWDAHDYNVIVCLEVMEHLPSPIKTVRELLHHLMPGGHLFVDFVKDDAPGGDNTPAAQAERDEVIALLTSEMTTVVPITERGATAHYVGR